MDLNVLNAMLNAGSIVAWIGLFYLMLSRGNIVTRRENTLTLALKDEIIKRQDATIKEQHQTIAELRGQNSELLEVTGLWKDFMASIRRELSRRGGGDVPPLDS